MTVKRNHPCPCGSGKRYKRCCVATQLDKKTTKRERACELVDRGNILLSEKKYEKALELYNNALSVFPEYARAHYNIGVVFEKIDDTHDAIESFRKALEYSPNDAHALYNIGVIRQRQGEDREAASCFEKAISVRPDYVEAYYNLGVVYKNLGELNESIANFRKALEIRPHYDKALNNLGTVFKQLGCWDDAIDSIKKSLAINADFAEAHLNLGVIYKEQGRKEESLACCKRALKIMPENAEAHRCLSSLSDYTEVNDHVLEMEKIFFKTGTADDQKIQLAFALGKVYEDLDQYEKSFRYLEEGNKLKRATFSYSVDEMKSIFDKIKHVFNEQFVSSYSDMGNLDKTPIFILGMPRSGTSLVEQILASHPEVYGAGELESFKEAILKATRTDLQHEVFDSIHNDPKTLSATGGEYLKELRRHSRTAKFITNKMPGNFLFLGAIILALPNAKIIHCVRNPMDNCLSIYKNFFVGEHNYAYNQGELAHYHLFYQDLMHHWHKVFPGMIYDISYEKLVSDQESETRNLLEYCELTWHDNCLSFHRTKRRVSTVSAVQVRKPIYKNSVGLWRKYEKNLHPLVELLLTTEPPRNKNGHFQADDL